VRFERLQKPVVGVDVHRAQERVRPGDMAQRRVLRPNLAEEEQRRTIVLDDPDLRVEPADLNLAGSVGDRDDAVGGAEIHADCNRNHSKTVLVTTHAKGLYRCAPWHAKRISRTGPTSHLLIISKGGSCGSQLFDGHRLRLRQDGGGGAKSLNAASNGENLSDRNGAQRLR
jgi:hypothetical protein